MHNKQKLANMGEGFDTEIGEIDGKPVHLDLYESFLLDNYGELGEAAVKAVGSGDKNNESGLTQYSWLSNATGIHIGWPGNGVGMPDFNKSFSISTASGREEAKNQAALVAQAEKTLESGTSQIAYEAERVLGEGGELEQEFEYKEEELVDVAQENVEGVFDQYRTIEGRTGMATTNVAKSEMKSGLLDLEAQYGTAKEKLAFQEEQERRQIESKLKKERAALFSSFMAATGEGYEGDDALAFDAFIEDYS